MPAPRSLRLEELTWPEVAEAVAAGYDTCIIVAGSIEQHGPHLPLLTDAALGEELALRTARRLGNALVAPVIRPGCSDHHMTFPGSLTISEDLLIALIEAYCQSLARHGFRTLVLLSSHGGNFAPIHRAAPAIQQRLGDTARVVPVVDLWSFIAAQNAAVAPFGIAPDHAGSHAGLAETSSMLVVRPDLVRQDRYEEGYRGEIDDELFTRGLRYYTQNGILGDARGSRAEYGEAILDGLADYLAAEVRRALGA